MQIEVKNIQDQIAVVKDMKDVICRKELLNFASLYKWYEHSIRYCKNKTSKLIVWFGYQLGCSSL